MPKYISKEALVWSTRRLFDSCNRLFADILILKHEGLGAGQPITISTGSTTDAATRLMSIVDGKGTSPDADHFFFNPFVGKWRHDEYPRSGTYSTLARSKTFGDALAVVTPGHGAASAASSTAAKGLQITPSPAFASQIKEALRRSKSKPMAVSEAAMALWTFRYDALPDDIRISSLKERFRSLLHLTPDEVGLWFTQDDPAGVDIFSEDQLDRDDFIAFLLAEYPESPEGEVVEASETLIEDVPEDLIDYLRGELILPSSLLRQLVTLVRAGKHIILTGPPGTGKSTLASRLAHVSTRYPVEFALPASSGALMTTATADWSTFDTLGGYMPDPEGTGTLLFNEGIFLESIRTNKWLIIDELNRADVDKAFGQFFTVLSGHDVSTGFKQSKLTVQIVSDRSTASSGHDATAATYRVGRDWRLIGTMNTSDRNILFQLSSAFLRRFAIVHVGIPSTEELVEWIGQRDLPGGDPTRVTDLLRLLALIRPLGPAIWLDLADYLEMRSEQPVGGQDDGISAFSEAVIAFILPQLDGLDFETLAQVEEGLVQLLPSDPDKANMRRTFQELFR